MEEILSAPNYAFIRTCFDRGMAAIYFVAFLSAFNQFPSLLGEQGLLPAPAFLKRTNFKLSPSLFHWKYSDFLLRLVCVLGMIASVVIILAGQIPIALHVLLWLFMYFAYLSIVNVGQDFYSFGWETMLLEAGFFAAFLGPSWVTPSWLPILILRWMLVRTELGAGLIKLRGDTCWKDLTCLYWHHETQPLPNPLSRFFHHMPKWFHRQGVVFSHFCQLVCPLFILLPQPIAGIAGAFLILHQLILIISGNYSWLNWLTVVLGFLAIEDRALGMSVPTAAAPLWFTSFQIAGMILCLSLSYRPLLNLFSKRQHMNYCWNRWHLVGAYGAFGSVTKERYEIVLEASDDQVTWKEYEFKGKPGDLKRIPPIVAPYHLRMDWMIWFLPFTVQVYEGQVYVPGHSLWFVRLIKKLLNGDSAILKLFRVVPLEKPKWVRARFYQYHFTPKGSDAIWSRKLLGEYCPAVSRDQLTQV